MIPKLKRITTISSEQPNNKADIWFQEPKPNLYDPYNHVELRGQFRDFNSGVVATNDLFNGLKIPVEPNKTYISAADIPAGEWSNLCYFDSNMSYLGGIAYNEHNKVFTTPTNCAFITVAIRNFCSKFILQEGNNIVNTSLQIRNKSNYDKFIEDEIVRSPYEPTLERRKIWLQTSKNLYNGSRYRGGGNVNHTIGNYLYEQKTADTNNNPGWKLQKYLSTWDYVGLISSFYVTEGKNSWSFVKTSDWDMLQFGVNGSTIDTVMFIDVSHLENDCTYTLSCDIIDKTQGSIKWANIQIERGSIATPYEDPSETNIWILNDNNIYENITSIERNGYVLYSNTPGTNNYLDLPLSTAKFKCIEIFFRNSDGVESNKKIYEPYNKLVELSTCTPFCDIVYFKYSKWKIGDKSIQIMNEGTEATTSANAFALRLTDGVMTDKDHQGVCQIYITKVIGYK